MFKNTSKLLALATFFITFSLLSGCIGLHDNSNRFLNDPDTGMSEVNLLKTYGTPSFSGETKNSRIYTYKVCDSKYIVLFGLYEGYDLIIECKDDKVVDTTRIKRASTFALFQPNLWGESFQ